jgi:heptosyltransferase-2
MEKVKYRFYPNTSSTAINKVKLIDKALDFVLGRRLKQAPKRPIRQITIVQFAHIGDLFLMLPAIKTLKSISNYQVHLVVSSQNFTIASQLDFVDQVSIADAPYFARGKKVSYWHFIKQLRQVSADLIFDVRGDLRNNIFIKLFTNHQLFAGYDVGGGGALLNVALPYEHEAHITGLINPLFDYLKLPLPDYSQFWSADLMPYKAVNSEVFPANFIIVHLGAGAQARRWPLSNFIKTIRHISAIIPVYVLGTVQDVSDEEHTVIKNIPNVISCIGRYSLLESIYVVKQCSLFLGLDSGFTHIAALLKKKVVVLFSGTVNSQVWKPFSFYQGQVSLVKKTVSCDWNTGCGKLECADNICMKQIKPLEVVGLLHKTLAMQESD